MTHTLDEGSSTPLYAQLRELLKSQIEDGSFAPGERIPSEDKLNGLYGGAASPSAVPYRSSPMTAIS